jgi:hypothetical protein
VNSTLLIPAHAGSDGLVLPRAAVNMRGSDGTEHALTFQQLAGLGILPGLSGAERGTNTQGDIVTQTIDGVDLNDLWDEFIASVDLQNSERQRIIDLLTFPVTQLIENVAQFSTEDFEEATEFGVPKGVRTSQSVFQMAYTFKWYDIAARFTWKFLADADEAQVRAINSTVLDADNRAIFKQVMKTIFNNANLQATIKGQNYNVFKLYNADGTVPPPYKTNTFDGTHTHYLTSGAATVDSGDLDALYDHLRHHGYSMENGTTLFLLANPAQTATIRTFRVSTGSTYDFVPAAGQPGFYIPTDVQLINQQQVANTFRGMNVIGNYGPGLVIEEDYIPAGYMVLVGSGGTANLQNVVGLREHSNPGLRGLRLVKGPNPDYPLVDSYYQRGFGTGIRQRGAAAVMQITASGTYSVPAAYV